MKIRKKTNAIEGFMFAGGESEPGWPDGWLSVPHEFRGHGDILLFYGNGNQIAEKGDVIIKHYAGALDVFGVCRKADFENEYEKVED